MINEALIHKSSDRTEIGVIQIRHEPEKSRAEDLFCENQKCSEVEYEERSKKPMEAK